MRKGELRARAVRMGLAVFAFLAVPMACGLLVDRQLGLWPWGALIAFLLGILAATYFVVRYTFEAFKRIEQAHSRNPSQNPTKASVKEDERL
ncbi:MAG: AtpZ/AtpI family protein [Anaerolineae bacterium]